MPENKVIPPYLLVINPFTGKHVNVLPLFKVLNENHAAHPGDLNNFIKPLQNMQDFLATEVTFDDLRRDNFMELGITSYNIVRLRKMFEAMNEPV